MLRYLFTLLLFLTLVSHSFSQITDVAPSGRQNYIAVEGGGWKMKIDTVTSLDSLIGRLSKNWQFIETGKMYWIGYTEDMYSIAARGDNAIQPLINVLQNSSSSYAKYGAVYCLHLIGINRTIAGRFYEKFVNPKARMALLQFLKDTSLQEDIMRLLIRDPWQSDIFTIIETMKTCKTDCWSLVNGLTRYKINNLPIHQTIPDNIKDISVNLRYTKPLVLEANFDFDAQIKEALDSFRHLRNKKIVIEDTLFKSKLIGDFGSKYESPVSVQEFFSLLDFDNYTSLGSRIQYYVAGDKLFICSPETARRLLIDWWTNLTETEKAAYNKNYR
jgi:hypothetical protein